ncbi:hypothetical protein D3C78_718960 [compost metagenome]
MTAWQLNRYLHAVDYLAGNPFGIFGPVQRRQQHGKLIASQACHQVLFTQLRPDPVSHRHQHRIPRGVAETIVDPLEAVTVEKQHRHLLIVLAAIAQGADQAAFEEGPVWQPGQAVVAGLVSQGFVFTLQIGLPGLQFIEQGIEVIAQAIQFGDTRRWHTLVKRALDPCGMGDIRPAP